MPRTKQTNVEFLHEQPVVAMWTGATGIVHTVTGRLYWHVDRLYLAGRRVSWLLANGAVLEHPDRDWLAAILPGTPTGTRGVTEPDRQAVPA